METKFYVALSLKTTEGFENYGRFSLGNNPKFARRLFKKLKGSFEADERNVLQLEFIETINGLPVNVNMLTCSLEELAENAKTITKEIFKQLNLSEL